MNETWENGKSLVFGLILYLLAKISVSPNFFLWILLLQDVRRCCKLSVYAISRKNDEANLRKWQKTIFGPIWFRQSLEIIVSYHHVQYQKKLMIQSWENLVTDGQTDKRTDRQTDKSDFIGHCSTNTKRPITKLINDTNRKQNLNVFNMNLLTLC